MADVAEVLMIEHEAIRHISRFITPGSEPSLADFHKYLKAVHIEIEEKIVFPAIEEKLPEGRKDMISTIEQIKADHKLIDTLAGNIAKWQEKGDTDLVNERFPLYLRLLKDHNLSEDRIVFPWWKELDLREVKSAIREAEAIIDSFGRENYIEIIGLSPESFVYMFE